MPSLARDAFCEALGTAFLLAVLILIFGPLSGAHLNPAVTVAFALHGKLPWAIVAVYVVAQVLGGVGGVWLTHLMFELPVWQFSTTVRTGAGQWLAEAVATFGLLLTVFGCAAHRAESAPYAVGLYITAAYWFTASTSFANPAVTIARSLSDTFGHRARRRRGFHRCANGGDARGRHAQSMAVARAGNRVQSIGSAGAD
jgi:glycerol uptake facilitator-like aquaporin